MQQTRKLKLTPLTRAMTALREVDAGSDVFEFPFSSEAPVDRWWGTEVLSHDEGAIDFSRLNDGAPLLWNHDRDCQIGVLEGARIGADKRAYCTVRMGTSAKAQEIRADVEAGIIRNVSVGYRIDKMVETIEDDDSTYTAIRWTPFEVSFVSIPADPGVGMGRSDSTETREIEVEIRGHTPAAEEAPMSTAATAAATAAPAVDVNAIRAEAAAQERARTAAIEELGRRFEQPDLARQLIEGERSIEDARTAFLEALGARQVPVSTMTSGVVDMTEREQQNYSIVRACQRRRKIPQKCRCKIPQSGISVISRSVDRWGAPLGAFRAGVAGVAV